MAKRTIWENLGFLEAWATRLQYLYALLTLPALSAILTAVSGYLTDIQPMWIIVASAATFSFMASGVLRFTEWRQKSAVAYKIDILGLYNLVDCQWNAEGQPTAIDKINVGFQLLNRAAFPIDYRIDDIQVVAENRIADVSSLLGRSNVIPAGIAVGSHPNAIIVKDLNTLSLKGAVNVTVSYGRNGRLKYSTKKKYEYELTVSPHQSQRPNLVVGFAVRDINPPILVS